MKKLKLAVDILLVAIILILLLNWFGPCKTPAPGDGGKKDTVRVVDTTYITVENTIIKKVPLVKQEIVRDTIEVPVADTNYATLKQQYTALANELSTRRIYQDSVTIDSIGVVRITDTVWLNRLQTRRIYYKYPVKIIKDQTTITEQAPQKRQFYLGGGLAANRINFTSAQAGLMYKDRKDRIIGGFVSVAKDGVLSYGVQSYWKISFNNR